MKKTIPVAIGILCVAVSCAEACTTTIVTKGASAEGVTYVTHSNDAYASDPSIVYVPAKDHPAGAMRKVYPAAIAWDELPEYECYETPRLVAPERAEAYNYPNKKRTKPLGEIPEAAHTYAYIDSDYGVMNERALSNWRDLYGNLLATHDGGRNLDYAETFQPKADKVLKY